MRTKQGSTSGPTSSGEPTAVEDLVRRSERRVQDFLERYYYGDFVHRHEAHRHNGERQQEVERQG